MGEEKEEEKTDSYAKKVSEEEVAKKKAEEVVKKRLQVLVITRDPLTARIVDLKNVQNVPQMNDACQMLREALEEYDMRKNKVVVQLAVAELFQKDKKGKVVAP